MARVKRSLNSATAVAANHPGAVGGRRLPGESPSRPKKRKRALSEDRRLVTGNWDDMPHNLGTPRGMGATPTAPSIKTEGQTQALTTRRSWRSRKSVDRLGMASTTPAIKAEQQVTETAQPRRGQGVTQVFAKPNSRAGNTDDIQGQSKTEVKSKTAPKKTKAKPYGLTPGVSPFPDWEEPTTDTCEEVVRLLASLHGEIKAPEKIPAPSLEVSGCGEVPSILDALIRTLLSANTTDKNSSTAFRGLINRFGILEEGIGKGSVDWNKVRLAAVEDVIETIKHGGLAKVKGNNIKKILDMVYEENQTRRQAYVRERETGKGTGIVGAEDKTQGQKDLEILKTDTNVLSLDHMHGMAPDQAMLELTKFPGIGVKTSACVILFCMRQPSFAVDTHVWRLCKWLKWVPPTATRDQTFSHCEVRIPNHLKYSLHRLFIRHGKTCGRCRAITSEGNEGWAEVNCPIEHLVERTTKKKGILTPKSSPRGKAAQRVGKTGRVEDESSDDDPKLSDHESDSFVD